eukprot:6497028-Ditylum_brightwellii.AAC.1
MSVTLTSESPVLVSYEITVQPSLIKEISENTLLDADTSSPGGHKDFVQCRLVVDGIPLRESSSHATPGYLGTLRSIDLSGNSVLTLGAGTHNVELHWQQPGTMVTSWKNIPLLEDGYSSGRVVTASSHYDYIWSTELTGDDSISLSGGWVHVKDSHLCFDIPNGASLRFMYSMNVRANK